jgi:4-carboxymuconolactone decarboxylase
MRLPLIPPADLTPEQKSLYDAMRTGIASNFNAFKVEREDGALMGPWNPWLHEPAIGKAIWDLTLAMTANASLPDSVRQVVILVVGARFDAAYEIYAHIAVAEREGMKPERLAALVADLKPNDLTAEENAAFDVAYKLVRGGTLPEPLYRLAVDTFGQHGTNELIYLVGSTASYPRPSTVSTCRCRNGSSARRRVLFATLTESPQRLSPFGEVNRS